MFGLKLLSAIALIVIVAACLAFMAGGIGLSVTKYVALGGTIAWFGTSILWMNRDSATSDAYDEELHSSHTSI